MKNRMRELRTCGTVRGEGREALTYSENVPFSSVRGHFRLPRASYRGTFC